MAFPSDVNQSPPEIMIVKGTLTHPLRKTTLNKVRLTKVVMAGTLKAGINDVAPGESTLKSRL